MKNARVALIQYGEMPERASVEYVPGEGDHPGEPAPGGFRVTLRRNRSARLPERVLHAQERSRSLCVRLGWWARPEGRTLDDGEREAVLDALAGERPGWPVFERLEGDVLVARRLAAGDFRVEAFHTSQPGQGEVRYYEPRRTMSIQAATDSRRIKVVDASLDRRGARWLHPAEEAVSDADWARVAAALSRPDLREHFIGESRWRLEIP